MNKQIIKALLLLLISPIAQNCHHQHDVNCDYDPVTQEGCTHVHDETCEEPEYELNLCMPNSDLC